MDPIIEEGIKPIVIDYKAKYEEIVKDLEALKEENKTLKTESEKVIKDKEEVIKDVAATKVLLDQANKNLESAKVTLTTKESDLSKEIALRESLEAKMLESNLAIKESAIENINSLRIALNKQVMTKEELLKRSEESLKDSINDLKEEMASRIPIIEKITKPDDPSLNSPILPVKETVTTSNIDLENGLANILKSMMN